MKWFEEYKCGCTSDGVKVKKDLCGYCPVHGENRINVYRESLTTILHVKREKP